MIGEVIGSYRVVRKLGSGGMGEVWAGEHLLLGHKVAIKFLLREVTNDETIVKRFFDEARAASQISDPGIVAVFDFGWHGGGAYIVMEQLVGESLGHRLQTRRCTLDEALRIAQQVALTMSVAHARGIIHRDLKPDNIFLVPDAAMPGGERAKILDFGIAKLIVGDRTASNTRSDVVMGTPTHMSPEQCRGSAGVDHRTDIYAVGCILYQLVCGRLPFIGPTMSDTIASHLLEPPPVPSALDPRVPPAVDAIALRCVAKAPGDRFATMTDLARALAAAAGTALDVATLPPVLPPVVPPGGRGEPAASESSELSASVASASAASLTGAVASEPAKVMTTLGTAAGESVARSGRRRGPWIAAVGSAIVVAGIATVVLIREPARTVAPLDAAIATGTGSGSGSGSGGPLDAAVPLDAAMVDAGRVDAAPPPDARKRHRNRGQGSAEFYQNR